MTREDFPREADNYDVWCERCRRVHRYSTFTREDYDRVIAEGAEKLRADIDKKITVEVYQAVYGKRSA